MTKHCDTCTCGCTCGYGGEHLDNNPRCELNAPTTGMTILERVNHRAHMDCYSTQDKASAFYGCVFSLPDCPMGALSR